MKKMDRDVDYAKNKVAGELKEAAGKITGNAQLELKGKIQSSVADLKKNLNAAGDLEDIKENIASGINNRIDKNNKR